MEKPEKATTTDAATGILVIRFERLLTRDTVQAASPIKTLAEHSSQPIRALPIHFGKRRQRPSWRDSVRTAIPLYAARLKSLLILGYQVTWPTAACGQPRPST